MIVDSSGNPIELLTDEPPAAPETPPAPGEITAGGMKAVLRKLGNFSQAHQEGRTEDAVTLLGEALGLFAAAQGAPVVAGTDYEIRQEPIKGDDGREGTRISVQDLTDAGRAFMGQWSDMISGMEAQSRESQLETLAGAVRGLMGVVARMQTQLDNQAVDIAKLQRKMRGKD